ncbi:TPA_asm: maturation protein [ssRNA phage SRR7976356_1]|uniref:Maturation protein n=1 Tax=ssRNA phage SRR7976356_1 TaxID=2786732 RepID=A0A8S5L5Q4_9VIRU|nr:maturation protein [ssRNA phage SRR7976356_1]DAD52807.1 TPA_asm: maturation protein [ssRNA phage SRR7976356_1]
MIKQGSDAGSSYSRTIGWTVESRPARFVWDNYKSPQYPSFGVYHYEVVGDYLASLISTPPATKVTLAEKAAMAREAKIGFLGKVREIVNPFQALPFLGELKETISMVRHPLKGITSHTRKYYKRARRILVRKGSGAIARDLNSAYLQWTYGVAPLIGDIANIGEAVKRLVEGEDKDVPVIMTVKREWIAESTFFIGGVSPSSAPIGISRQVTAQDSYRIKGAVRKEILSANSPESYRFDLGISLSEFVPTAWELLPYSFLVDYFTNVGDVLGALFTSHRAIRYYWASDKYELRGIIAGVALPQLGYTKSRSGSSVANFRYVSFKREKPDLSVSIADLSLRHPTVKQWCNTTSLALARM